MIPLSASYRLPLYSGILEHRGNIGIAIYEFIWCIDRTTEEHPDPERQGKYRGIVLGGRWVTYQEIADDLEVSRDTVKNNLKKLAVGGYIAYDRKPHGAKIEVLNSKKWMERQGESSLSRGGESSLSHERWGESSLSREGTSSPSREGTSSLSESRWGESSLSRGGESSPSNRQDTYKTEKEDAAAFEPPLSANEILEEQNGAPSPVTLPPDPLDKPPPEFDVAKHGKDYEAIVSHVMQNLGKGRLSVKENDTIRSFLAAGIDRDLIIDKFDEKLAQYAADNHGRYFSSFVYCKNVILDAHAANQQVVQGLAQTAATRSPRAEPTTPDWMQELGRRMMAQNGNGHGTHAAT